MDQRRGKMRKRKASWLFPGVPLLGNSIMESYSLTEARATRCPVQCMLMRMPFPIPEHGRDVFCMLEFLLEVRASAGMVPRSLARSQPMPTAPHLSIYSICKAT
jgi:hypothetical protein